MKATEAIQLQLLRAPIHQYLHDIYFSVIALYLKNCAEYPSTKWAEFNLIPLQQAIKRNSLRGGVMNTSLSDRFTSAKAAPVQAMNAHGEVAVRL